MKVLFEHDGHKIILSRGVITSELSIDAELCDACNGFTNNQVKSFELSGNAVNPDGVKNRVRVRVETNLFHDNVSLYYNDNLVDSKKVSIF